MKKTIYVILALLIILSLCSCGETPEAKELFLSAAHNTQGHDYLINMNIGMGQSGVSSATKITIDGAKDDYGNHHALYTLALSNVTYSGEMYYFDKDMVLYLQVMDVWMELYLTDYFAGLTIEELRSMFSAFDIERMLKEDNMLSYSEVKKSGKDYVFDIYVEDNENTREMLAQMLSSAEDTSLNLEQYIDIICNMGFSVKINKSQNTVSGISADFRRAFSVMDELFGTEFTEFSLDIENDNHGKTKEIKLDESIPDECVSMIELMYYLVYSQIQYE